MVSSLRIIGIEVFRLEALDGDLISLVGTVVFIATAIASSLDDIIDCNRLAVSFHR
jgi:hypothetical protein